MKITILYDDHKINDALISHHGFSACIEYNEQNILFDTGQDESTLLHNAKKLGIDLDKVTHILLSHGHYDHTGGAHYFTGKAKIFAQEGIFGEKYREKEGSTYIGIPLRFKERLREFVVFNNEMTEILPDVYLSGKLTAREKTGLYHKTRKGITNDYMDDEQFLIIKTQKGAVIITGCSHKGIINIVTYVLTKVKMPIHAIVGGLHLYNVERKKIAETANYLRNLTNQLYYCHCTGKNAEEILNRALNAEKLGVGSIITL